MSNDFLKQCGGFNPQPDILIQKYGPAVATVWGVVWRYCQQTGEAQLTFEQIANRAKVSRRSTVDHVKKLIDDGFIEDKTPNVRNEGHVYSVSAGEVKLLGMRKLHTYDDDGMQELHTDPVEGMQYSHTESDESPDSHADSADRGMQILHELDSNTETINKNPNTKLEVEGEVKINFDLPPHLHTDLQDKWVYWLDDSEKLREAVVVRVTPKQLKINIQGIGIKRVDPTKRVYYQNGGPGLSPVGIGEMEPKEKRPPLTEAEKAIFDTFLEIMPQADFIQTEKWRESQRINDLIESAKRSAGKGITPADLKDFVDWHKTIRWGDVESPPPISLEIIKKNWIEFKDWRSNHDKQTNDPRGNSGGKRTAQGHSSQTEKYLAENETDIRDSLARLKR